MEIKEGPSGTSQKSICFIGIGNEYRCDDAAGIALVKILENQYNSRKNTVRSAVFFYAGEDTISVVHMLAKYKNLMIADAVVTGSPAGTIFELNLENHIPEKSEMKLSGHSLDVFDAVRMARELYSINSKIHFIGIEGRNFTQGNRITPEVNAAVNKAAEKILDTYNFS